MGWGGRVGGGGGGGGRGGKGFVDGGDRTHDPKTHGPADDAIC